MCSVVWSQGDKTCIRTLVSILRICRVLLLMGLMLSQDRLVYFIHFLCVTIAKHFIQNIWPFCPWGMSLYNNLASHQIHLQKHVMPFTTVCRRYFCDLLTWDFWQKRKVFIENSFCGLRRQLECAVAREVAPSWSQSQLKSNLGFLFTSRHLRRSRSDTVSPTFRGFHPSLVCLVLFVLYRCMLLRRGMLFQKVTDTFPTLKPIIWTWEAPLQKFPNLFST